MSQNPASTFQTPKLDDTESMSMRKVARYLACGLGLGGVDIYADASAHTGTWWCMHAITDTVVSSITYAPGTSSGSLAGKTILAGDRIYGQILGFTATSGTFELYRAVP